ncbi:MAG: hypothetical protein WDO19_26970 [Bacteroidota bacterium]
MQQSVFPIHRIAILICNFIAQTLSPEEARELNQWVAQNEANQKLFEELTDPENINSFLMSALN